ncbi:MAG TPA: hypothetical protein PKC34_11655 [Pseudomonadales bacterium]|nr:hypothetical protein [Pseudomonadales bacterium]HMU91337.1 hypothetical protein [Pseudomonadales bacterium]HMW16186.1 hypothetical protein [Pseudomonadales bacterium]HMY97981.1 hypothetical protein [Pseudomonadales bacterium]
MLDDHLLKKIAIRINIRENTEKWHKTKNNSVELSLASSTGKQQDVMREDGWNATYTPIAQDAPSRLLASAFMGVRAVEKNPPLTTDRASRRPGRR